MVSDEWHTRFGIERLDRGWVEAGIPVVGRVKVHREALAMVYVCELTNLPFLVVLPGAK
ncbi:MAG: hypothetical protein OK422_04440 [Thaumarchaeota archaeon]|nr:hypothetical protein [Nitrososphaerota archaeon]